jgi:hypothetical protein
MADIALVIGGIAIGLAFAAWLLHHINKGGGPRW